jgi:malic enzyme
LVTRKRISKRGHDLVRDPLLNKGAAFTERERREFGLEGILPATPQEPSIQARRTYKSITHLSEPLDRYVALSSLQDRNEHLFFQVLDDHIEDLLPIIYTPTVGLATQRFSHVFQRGRGIWITPDHRGRMKEVLRNATSGRDIRLIVATDNESILGIGDQGAGGMAISIGKLALYTAAAGIDPSMVLPVSLDFGTENEELLNDDVYLGWRHPRIRGEDYASLIDEFMSALADTFPDVLVQWEDFRKDNALRVLDRYRRRQPSFNDDIQGTGAVALAAVLAAGKISGRNLHSERIIVLGAGAAGLGIARQIRAALAATDLDQDDVTRRIAVLDRKGLIIDDESIRDEYKRELAWSPELAAGLGLTAENRDFATVVKVFEPTVLIGTSGQPGAFTQEIISQMGRQTDHPLILPISNPTSHSEAQPQDIFEWTGGNCLIAAGNPFPPVVTKSGTKRVSQGNNAFVFPGVGLAALVGRISYISDDMFTAAASQLAASINEAELQQGQVFPAISELRRVAAGIAEAVIRQAIREGMCELDPNHVAAAVRDGMWSPEYPAYYSD